MAKLRPFRQYHENDVINLFSFDALPAGVTVLNAGLMVVIKGVGWNAGQEFGLESINNNYPNTVSDRWNVAANVERANEGGLVDNSEERPLGMLLYDVREHDENGEKLLWHPRKYHEMQVALLGHAVPVLTRGIVMLSDVNEDGGVVAAGTALYAGSNGTVTTDATGGVANATAIKMGSCLGGKDNGNVLVRLDVGL